MPGSSGSTRTCRASRTATSRQAASGSTSAPSGTAGERESTTRPTAPPFIVSPTSQARRVGLAGVHPAAHVRVDRHREHPDDDLAVGRVGTLELDQPEVLGGRLAVRTGRQLPLARR